jgi:hypothetical protein
MFTFSFGFVVAKRARLGVEAPDREMLGSGKGMLLKLERLGRAWGADIAGECIDADEWTEEVARDPLDDLRFLAGSGERVRT